MTTKHLVYTLTSSHQFQQDIRKSVFLAHAVPVHSETEVAAVLRKLKVPEATHNCWAYRIGQKYGTHDDGEPSGTAGRPILQAIERQNFDSVLVLVIRWFGGIKLGAGGLIRAYIGTASECLRQAPSELYVPRHEMQVTCLFSDYAFLCSRMADYGVILLRETFNAMDVRLTMTVPQDQVDLWRNRMMDLTRGQVKIESER